MSNKNWDNNNWGSNEDWDNDNTSDVSIQEPIPLFRLPSNQDESQYLTPSAKRIAWHLDQMGIADDVPEEPAFKLESVPAPEAFSVGSQPTEPEAIDETAQFFKQMEQALEKRKAETAALIAHYNQHGWPTYGSGTDTHVFLGACENHARTKTPTLTRRTAGLVIQKNQ